MGPPQIVQYRYFNFVEAVPDHVLQRIGPIRQMTYCSSHENSGSSTNEVRGDICAFNVLGLIDEGSAATEPERLAHISLGQENPRMRMNAAPG